MLGIYHPFLWNRKLEEVDTQTVYKVNNLDVILTGEFASIVLVDALTLAETTPTITPYTYTVRGVTVYASRVKATLTENLDYFLKVDGIFYSDIIRRVNSNCFRWINTSNSCSNQYFDWDSDSSVLRINMADVQELPPIIETESETLITETGQQDKTLRINKKYRIQFVAPIGYIQLLNGLKVNDFVTFEGNDLINIEVEAQEQEGGRYSLFVLTYQIKSELQDGNTCCDIIDIDDIISPDNGGGSGDCAGFTATVDYIDGELSATLTDPPEGVPTYKWYRNGIYQTSATTVLTSVAGDWRVDVRIGNCTAKSNYYISDECAAMALEITKTLNTINAAVSNIPDGETVDYSIVLNGTEVATSVPYTAVTSGIYYIYATAGECNKVKGISITIEDNDCDFTLDITQTGNTLEADTDATTPSYLWELETSAGRNTIGTAATQGITLKGIYWLTVTQGTCSKESYLYIEPLVTSGVFLRYGGTGTAFTVLGINLLNIVNYAGDIKVTVNGVVFSHVGSSPGANQYTVNNSGQVVVQTSLTNPTIIIELI
jgi:hypothetical protein